MNAEEQFVREAEIARSGPLVARTVVAGGRSRHEVVHARARTPERGAKVTFALPLCPTTGSVSVVGDFNDRDPTVHPMKKRSNGTRSVSVDLPAGATYRFKYLAKDDATSNSVLQG